MLASVRRCTIVAFMQTVNLISQSEWKKKKNKLECEDFGFGLVSSYFVNSHTTERTWLTFSLSLSLCHLTGVYNNYFVRLVRPSMMYALCVCGAKRLSHNPNTLEFWLENFPRILVSFVVLLFGPFMRSLFHFLPTTLDVSRTTLFHAIRLVRYRIPGLLNVDKKFTSKSIRSSAKERKKKNAR